MRFHFFCCLISTTAAPIFAQLTPNPANSNCGKDAMLCWEKVFIPPGNFECTGSSVALDDDFKTLDPANWQTYFFNIAQDNSRTSIACDETIFLDKNVAIDPSQNFCVIESRYEPSPVSWTAPSGAVFTRHFSSGVLYARDAYHFGHYEAVFEDMPGGGWWPAFWMINHVEFDIMERFWDRNVYDYAAINTKPGGIKLCSEYAEVRDVSSPDLFGGPHTFGMDWSPFALTFFHNGKALPDVFYRFYRPDGSPLKINCNDPIPEGTYFLNPGFPLPYNFDADQTASPNYQHPIIAVPVLPHGGLKCCDEDPNSPNHHCFDDPDCSDHPDCADWGNPVFWENTAKHKIGDERPGCEKNTKTLIDRVTVTAKSYKAHASIAIKYRPVLDFGPGEKAIATIEAIGGDDLVFDVQDLKVVSYTPEILAVSPIAANRHQFELTGLKPGTGIFKVSYLDDFGMPCAFERNIEVVEKRPPDTLGQVCSGEWDFAAAPEIIAFPNPAHDFVKIQKVKGPEPVASVALFDCLGKSLGSPAIEWEGDIANISTKNLPAGLYFAKIGFGGKSKFIRFVKI